MLLGIDHVVVAVEDPDATAGDITTRLGLDVDAGGRHESLGTFNRVVWLGDSYLELIGVSDTDLAADSWLGAPSLATLDRGGGLATWAVAVDDLDAQLGWVPPDVGMTVPLDGERRRPDGRVVRWRLAHAPEVSSTVPFLIEHDGTAAEWTSDERAARSHQRHPIGGRVRMTGLEVVTDRPAVAAGRLRKVLATSAEPIGRMAVRVVVGHQELRVMSNRARGSAAVELIVDLPLRRRSMMVGDCEIRLRGVAPKPMDDGGSSAHHPSQPSV